MKKILIVIYAMTTSFSLFSQSVLEGIYLNPLGVKQELYKGIAFGNPNNKWGGFMWNNTNTLFGNGDDFTIYTYDSREIVLAPGGGNIVLNPRTTKGNIGIGVANPSYKLDVNGTIHAREVRIDLDTWPDYVFYNDYNLLSLQQVEEFIMKHGHLPNISSAEEIKKSGLNLKEMNIRLLEKVEELTLYAIKQNKLIRDQQIKEAELQKELIEQKELVISILKRIENLEDE